MALRDPLSLREVRQMSGAADTILLTATRNADLETPIGAFMRFDDGGPAFLLESVEGGERLGRYSFLGVGPRRLLTVRDNKATIQSRPVGVTEFSPDLPTETFDVPDPLAALRHFMPKRRILPSADIPRFPGGAVGALAYDAASTFEPTVPLPTKDPTGVPMAAFQETDLVLVFAIKDAFELEALRAASGAAYRVAAMLQRGDIRLIGRREADVSNDISTLLVAEGHERVNFAIVGSGPNAASPHHEPGSRIIGPNETVVCDFGGTLSLDGEVGYCSDITRTVVTGAPSDDILDCYEVLLESQQTAVASARAGVSAEAVDAVARSIIDDAGYGDLFIHRTGHGIGIEEHEDPYLVAGNDELLRPGNAFSVEPGIYASGRFGMRLEDIVIITEDGNPESLNTVDHALVVVEA